MLRGRARWRGSAAVALVLAACAGAARPPALSSPPVPASAPEGPAAAVEVTLYRDRALIMQRVDVEIPRGGTAVVRARVAAGVAAEQVFVAPRRGEPATVVELRAARTVPTAPAPPAPRIGDGAGDPCAAPPDPAEITVPGATAAAPVARTADDDPNAVPVPTELDLTVTGPPGRAAVTLGYVTTRLTWEAAYTLVASPARDAATLRGALAVTNATGLELAVSAARLVDNTFDASRAALLDRLVVRLGRPAIGAPAAAIAAVTAPRDLGRLELRRGETRVELLPAAARRLRSVLVYDPIGTKLDYTGAEPVRDRALGVVPRPPRRVDESFELARDASTAGLPAGAVQLLERRRDGTLALLGTARLFEESTRAANTDTIAVGTADDVLGRRDRRELTLDEPGRRLAEDFVITIENRRAQPVEVVVREHLYRGQNWTLAFISVPTGLEAKEGPQQVAPRITVPARSTARLMYVVVYTW